MSRFIYIFFGGFSRFDMQSFWRHCGEIEHSDADNSFKVPIFINECAPYDGGIFKDYDTIVTWKDGIEHRC